MTFIDIRQLSRAKVLGFSARMVQFKHLVIFFSIKQLYDEVNSFILEYR